MSKDFLVWKPDLVPGAVLLLNIENYGEDELLAFGESVEADWPDDAAYRFDPDTKRDTLLLDSLDNAGNLLVCSEKLAAVLKQHEVSHIEYLPITVLDHKKKPIKEPYVLVHTVNHVPCLDMAASKAKKSKLMPDMAGSIKKLVLDEKKIPADRSVFRVAEYHKIVLVRRAVAEALDAAKVTGIRWIEVKDYEED